MNYYYPPFTNDTYLNRLQRLNQMQNQFNQYANNITPQNNQIIFVQGETGAKAYQIPNNTTVLLMSSESNEFFIKTTDSSGFPTIRKFTFQEQPNQEQQPKQCSCDCQNNSTAPLPLQAKQISFICHFQHLSKYHKIILAIVLLLQLQYK